MELSPEEQFQKLYSSGKLKKFIAARFPGIRDAWDDILQETMFALYKKIITNPQLIGDMENYAKGIAYKKACTLLKKENRHNNQPLDDLSDYPNTEQGSYEFSMEHSKLADLLLQLMIKEKTDCYHLLKKIIMNEEDPAKIAAEKGLETNSIYKQKTRCLSWLKGRIDKDSRFNDLRSDYFS